MKKLPVFAVIACYVLANFVRYSTAIVMPIYAESFALSASFVGLASAMYFLPYALIQPFSSPIFRKYGIGRSMVAFLCLTIAGILFMGFASNVIMVYVGRFLIGIGMGPYFVAVVMVLQKYYKGKEYVKWYGLTIFFSNLGSAVASAPLKLVINNLGTKGLFVSIASILFVFLFVFIGISHNDNRETELELGSVFKSLVIAYDSIRKSKILGTIILFWIGHSTSMLLYQSLWCSKWASVSFPLFEKFSGFTGSLVSIGVMTSCAMGDGLLFKKVTRNKKVLLSHFMLCVTFLSVIAAHLLNAGLFCFLFLLLSDALFGFSCGYLCIQVGADVRECVLDSENGSIMGIFNSTSALISFIIQQFSGFIIDGLSSKFKPIFAYSLPFIILWICLVLALVKGVTVLVPDFKSLRGKKVR